MNTLRGKKFSLSPGFSGGLKWGFQMLPSQTVLIKESKHYKYLDLEWSFLPLSVYILNLVSHKQFNGQIEMYIKLP